MHQKKNVDGYIPQSIHWEVFVAGLLDAWQLWGSQKLGPIARGFFRVCLFNLLVPKKKRWSRESCFFLSRNFDAFS